VVAQDALVSWHYNVVDQWALSLQWNLVSACLIYPSQRETLIVLRAAKFTTTMSHRIVGVETLLWLLHSLRVDKGVPQDGFL